MQNFLDLKNNQDEPAIKEAAQIIKNGGIVVFPTETVYGIGANALDETAIEKLYEVKDRPLNKPISLLVNSMEMVEKIAKEISEVEYNIMKAFFPGPLTIILKKKDIVPNIVTANCETVGVRMPANEIALKLIEYAGTPIATPSANISGKPSGIDIKQIKEQFGEKVDYYIDGGTSQIGLASTIVQIIDEVPFILREGLITKEQIEKVCYKNT